MKLKSIVAGLLVISAITANGQAKRVDLALGFNGSNVVVSPSFMLSWSVLNERINVGTGLRMNYLTSNDALFTNESYSDFADALYQTTVSNYSSASFNIPVHAFVRLGDKLILGAGLDIIGLSFGGSNFTYVQDPANNEVYASAKPSGFNLFLGGSGNIGSLSSEVFAGYSITDRITARAGFNYFSTEVKIDASALEIEKLSTRFGMGFIAINFRFGSL